MGSLVRVFSVLFVLAGLTAPSFAVEIPKLPNNLRCFDQQGNALPFQNEQVAVWKKSIPNGGVVRALIQGTVTDVYASPNKAGRTHTHFAINVDQYNGGDLEVIFNDDFGDLPNVVVGMKIEVCGDYITVNQRSSRPSPMDAIIHWTHYNPGNRDAGKHKDGFLIINNKPYGFTTPDGDPPYRGPKYFL